ncbi:hypothetical protein [Parasulfuritortus cantonensis]|uniref:hypothetical protein n=1 Tax=Parasulfuritortus cantonensis TaxID=2528202 RepID=UPI00197D0C29|nr:hypothetical protein [Parasulfuritortus cantonensis]
MRAINFVLEDTVEHRVRQVLEEKLEVIAQEFGVDKAADVMDSVEPTRSSTNCSCTVCRTRMPSNRSATRCVAVANHPGGVEEE